MPRIIIGEDEKLESGLKRFRRSRQKEGTVAEYKRKQYYTKPSDARRAQKKKAIRRMKRKQARRKQY
jgi:small subunit ribosomal protein S21